MLCRLAGGVCPLSPWDTGGGFLTNLFGFNNSGFRLVVLLRFILPHELLALASLSRCSGGLLEAAILFLTRLSLDTGSVPELRSGGDERVFRFRLEFMALGDLGPVQPALLSGI